MSYQENLGALAHQIEAEIVMQASSVTSWDNLGGGGALPTQDYQKRNIRIKFKVKIGKNKVKSIR